ncbi:uncharacterized protein FSUBG_4120 [Fusarium subglutinans]|uniref:Uncharacterized protein n=1 Tax=Gibberella subglutinans TaxID=42677 RepID=A0A8H5Q621_GIBSU|nr:uncharacterized protein FSUBG_4120 [Fusarium subglutinans]KAF5609327.1 hypothetical protein FSUBG_4120 [Fusarium subglutinans]
MVRAHAMVFYPAFEIILTSFLSLNIAAANFRRRFNLKYEVVNVLVPLHYNSMTGRKASVIDNVLTARLKSEAALNRVQKRKADDITADQATPAPEAEKPNSTMGRRSGASGAAGPHLDTVAAPWEGPTKPKAPKHAMGGAAKELLGWLDVEIGRLQTERAVYDSRCKASATVEDCKTIALLDDEIKEMENNSASVPTPSLEDYLTNGRVVAKKDADAEKEAKFDDGASDAQTIVTSTQEGNSASYEMEFQDYFKGALIPFVPPKQEDFSTYFNKPQAFASETLV